MDNQKNFFLDKYWVMNYCLKKKVISLLEKKSFFLFIENANSVTGYVNSHSGEININFEKKLNV